MKEEDIDWEEAPEGTEYYYFGNFYKLVKPSAHYFDMTIKLGLS